MVSHTLDKHYHIAPSATWPRSLQSALSGLAPEEAASWTETGENLWESREGLSHPQIKNCFLKVFADLWIGFDVVFGEVLRSESFPQLGDGDLD